MCRGTLAKTRRARRGMAGVRAESLAQFSKKPWSVPYYFRTRTTGSPSVMSGGASGKSAFGKPTVTCRPGLRPRARGHWYLRYLWPFRSTGLPKCGPAFNLLVHCIADAYSLLLRVTRHGQLHNLIYGLDQITKIVRTQNARSTCSDIP